MQISTSDHLTFVGELFSLVILQTYPCSNDNIFLRHDKDIEQELLLDTDSIEAVLSDSGKDIAC